MTGTMTGVVVCLEVLCLSRWEEGFWVGGGIGSGGK